jgi:hypothetical protein
MAVPAMFFFRHGQDARGTHGRDARATNSRQHAHGEEDRFKVACGHATHGAFDIQQRRHSSTQGG